MTDQPAKRIMQISTHGYVSADIEFGMPDTGGQVVYVLELSKCLARFGYQVDIFTRQFEDQPRFQQVSDNCRIVRIPCGGKDFLPKETICEAIPEWIQNANAFIKENNLAYDFINSHYWDAGLAGMGVANAFNITHIHTPHSLGAWKRANMDGEPDELEAKYNFNRRVRDETVLFDECDGIIATTPQQRDLLRGEFYGVAPDKINVIPPGYDDTRFFPVSKASRAALKLQYGYEGRIVLALGRIARNKGYDLLIQAMEKVCHRNEDVKLLLAIGSTEPNRQEREMTEELKQLAQKLRLGKRVIFADYIPDDELPDYYRLADVFALSSRYEPFGMTAVEAMACGTPLVCTTEGGLWERLDWGLNGIYANPFDPYEYGSAIHHALAHPRLWNQLSRNGAHRARADFTWIGIGQQVINMIKGPSIARVGEGAEDDDPRFADVAGAPSEIVQP
ncbi:MAG: glycosyltransferase [Planctomycetota bacterium]